MLWKKKGNRLGQVWISWQHVTTPKRMGGAALLDLNFHMASLRFSLLQALCVQSHPWTDIAKFFIEETGISHGRTVIHVSWWHVLNSSRPLTIPHSSLLSHLISSWQTILRLTV